MVQLEIAFNCLYLIYSYIYLCVLYVCAVCTSDIIYFLKFACYCTSLVLFRD